MNISVKMHGINSVRRMNTDGKALTGRPRHRWNNIRLSHKEIE
jgi:hypothetical protein